MMPSTWMEMIIVSWMEWANLAGEFVGSAHAFFQGDVFFFGDQEWAS